MTKKHKHKHKSEHHAPPRHKPMQIYQDIGKQRSRKFLPLIIAIFAFASIGSYLLFKSYAAGNYSFTTIIITNPHRGPVTGATISLGSVYGYNGPYCTYGGGWVLFPSVNTGTSDRKNFYCSHNANNPGAFTVSVSKPGHLQTSSTGPYRVATSPSCNASGTDCGSARHYITINMAANPDGDGLWDHQDRCRDISGANASYGCPAPKVDFYSSPASISYSGSTKLTWSASYMVAGSCTASANPANSQWSGIVAASSNKTISGLTKSTSFSLTCNNGQSSTKTTSVTVGAAPAPPPPAAAPAPAPSTSSTGRNTGTRAPAKPAVQASPQAQSDSSPPSTPTDFTAVQEGREVKFTWGASTDNVGVSSYKIERSTDETNWSTLSESITDTNYTDDTFSFDTKYFYRLAAYDAAGNGSEYVQLDITTGPFDASALEQPFSIESEDRLIKIEFEGGTFDKEALCEVFLTDESRNKFGKVAIGPYKVVCKDKEGTEITEFKKPANVRMSAPEGVNISKVEVYALVNDEAQNVNSTLNEQRDAQLFTLDKPTIFAGVEKSSSKWWIGPIIIIPLAILAYLLWRLRQRRLAESQTYNEDYAAPYPATTYEQQPTQPEQPAPPPITSHEYPWTNEDDTQQRQ